MKKLILCLAIFFSFGTGIYAQTPTPISAGNIITTVSNLSIPGLDCGVGGATDGSQKCCNVSLQLNNIPSLPVAPVIGGLLSLPVVGDLIKPLTGLVDDTQKRITVLQKFNYNNPKVACISGEPKPSIGDLNCFCEASSSANNRSAVQLCYNYLSNSSELGSCLSCASKDSLYTGIGCVPLNLQSFIGGFLLSMGIGFGGLVAILCIIYSAFMMQTSQGSAEKIKKAQETLTSCIMGLMLIIFSVFILKLIGVDILKIPFLK